MGSGISRVFDFEYSGTRLKQIDATFDTPANTEVYFYYRLANELKNFDQLASAWTPFLPNSPSDQESKGRYLQLKIELLPDGTRMFSPKISDLAIIYEPDLPPSPPVGLTATPGNGRVALRWRKVNEKDIRGYKIYYGNSPGNYWGTGSAEGDSPIDVGSRNDVTLTGLENGSLYYFTVLTYDAADPPHQSNFSMEVNARPSGILP